MTLQPCKQPEKTWAILGGFLLSIGIHVLLLLQSGQFHVSDADSPHQTHLAVELVSMANAHEVTQQLAPPIAQEKAEPQKKEKKIIKPEPAIKATAPAVKRMATQKKTVTNTSESSTTVTKNEQHSQSNQQPSKHMRQQYLSQIMSIIQSHKTYPYSARHRRIEGDVHISFMINLHGQISQLRITGGSASLRSATLQAIEESLPFPLPSAFLLHVTHVELIMQYRLK